MAETQTGTARNWENDPVLTVEHLTMRFGGLVAIDDLSFNVGRGDITALIGPNGAGKTTVFNCVTGFYKPTEGRIVMRHGPGAQTDLIEAVTNSGDQFRANGSDAVYLLERMPDFRISHKAKVARTFQNIRLFGGMTVLENLLVAQHNPLMDASNFTIGGLLGFPGYKEARKKSVEKAVYWLEHVRLLDRADDPAADLPYGAQRRLEIARAMCTGPHLLCLDEPAAGLNPRESAELNELLQFIRKEHDTSILLIEHDMGVVMEISDHVVVLDYGKKISDGSAEEVRNDPKVIAAYLGVDEESAVEEVLDEDKAIKARKRARATASPVAAAVAVAAPAETKTAPTSRPKAAAKAKSPSTKPASSATARKAAAPGARAAKRAPASRSKASAAASTPLPSNVDQSALTLRKKGKAAEQIRAEFAKDSAKRAAAAKARREKETASGTKARKGKSVPKAKAPEKSAVAAKPAKATASAKPVAVKRETVPAPKKASAGRPKAANTKAPAKAKTARLAAPRGGKADNLTLIKGIGTVNEKKLNDHGIFHFDQIAGWKAADIKAVEAYLEFDGRIARENWVKQARTLAKGGATEFSKRATTGKVATSRAGKSGRNGRGGAKR